MVSKIVLYKISNMFEIRVDIVPDQLLGYLRHIGKQNFGYLSRQPRQKLMFR